jgi:hypothetical protein
MRQNMLGKWSFSTDGMLAGLFFNRTFEAGPPLAEANKNMSFKMHLT